MMSLQVIQSSGASIDKQAESSRAGELEALKNRKGGGGADNKSDLYSRLQFLIHDMLRLKEDDRWVWDVLHPPSDCTSAASIDEAAFFNSIYLSSMYFARDEARLLAQFPMPDGTAFSDAVTALVRGKFSDKSAAASSTGAHICSSHDLAPLFRRVFGLDHNFFKSGDFAQRHAAFEKQVQKIMKRTPLQEATTKSSPTPITPAAAATPAAALASTLAPDTPQLVKLRALQAELAAREAEGQSDSKLAKQIQTLEKEVKRMEKKK
jgi:hypothetical protein